MLKSKGKHLFVSALLITFAFIIANCGGGGNNDDVPGPNPNPTATPAILPDETPSQDSEGTVPTATPTITPNETPTEPPTESWQVITNPTGIEGTPDFSDVYFVNETIGYITSSSDEKIFKTADGTETFSSPSTQDTTNAIHMLNATVGYAGGASGFIYNTSDEGFSWPFFGTMVANLADISFPPTGDTGYACGINGNIYSISTNPNAVSKMTSNVNGNLYSISFPVNSSEGWVCGGDLIRHYTSSSWTGDQDYPSGAYNAIHFVDNNNGWAVGDSGIIIHTNDGENWSTQQTNSAYILTDVFFLNTLEGWAVGSGGTILHTTNGGSAWTQEGTGLTSSILTSVHFVSTINGNVGYIVGNGKTLIKFNGLAE